MLDELLEAFLYMAQDFTDDKDKSIDIKLPNTLTGDTKEPKLFTFGFAKPNNSKIGKEMGHYIMKIR